MRSSTQEIELLCATVAAALTAQPLPFALAGRYNQFAGTNATLSNVTIAGAWLTMIGAAAMARHTHIAGAQERSP